jgi:ribonuclease HI/probable phosphoglycerate mutase
MTGGNADEWVLAVDGGARGNPGPAGAGLLLTAPDGRRAAAEAVPLGRRTNNEAEYEALLHGLELARRRGAARLVVRSDSELLVRQMTGEYRVKAAGFASIRFESVPRSENAAADRLANEAMDRAAGPRGAGRTA